MTRLQSPSTSTKDNTMDKMSVYKQMDILSQVTKQTGYLSVQEKRDVLKFYEINGSGLNQLVGMVKFNRDMSIQPVIKMTFIGWLSIQK